MNSTRNERCAVLALSLIPGIGAINAIKLVQLAGSAEAVFSEAFINNKLDRAVPVRIRSAISKGKWLIAAERRLDILESKGISVLSRFDADYPRFLRMCPDAPLMLYRKGAIDLRGDCLLSVVGTRRCTAYGRGFVQELLQELVPFDPVIVSGFAYGIDIHAHTVANRLGLQTVACLAHGFDSIYPTEHHRYVDRIEGHGGFLTELMDDGPIGKPNFLRRNRIIAGLSPATLVVESAQRGGSLATARMALSYQREVFALPGRYTDVYSKGCNDLIKRQQAIAVTSAQDLICELGWDTLFSAEVTRRVPQFESERQQELWDLLGQEKIATKDQIALRLGWSMTETAAVLLELELGQLIKSLPGNRFSRV